MDEMQKRELERALEITKWDWDLICNGHDHVGRKIQIALTQHGLCRYNERFNTSSLLCDSCPLKKQVEGCFENGSVWFEISALHAEISSRNLPEYTSEEKEQLMRLFRIMRDSVYSICI